MQPNNYEVLPYDGDDVATEFPISWNFGAADDIIIYHYDSDDVISVLSNPADYSVTGGDGATGTAILVSALPTGERIAITRDEKPAQDERWRNAREVDTSLIEYMDDKIMRVLQQHAEILQRCVKSTPGALDPIDYDDLLAVYANTLALYTNTSDAYDATVAVYDATVIVAANASDSADAAAESETNAAASAASLLGIFPAPITANNFLRANAAGDAYESKTDAEVAALMEAQNLVNKTSANAFSALQKYSGGSLSGTSGSATWNVATSPVAVVTLTDDITITPTNMSALGWYGLVIDTDGYEISWSSDFEFDKGVAPDSPVGEAVFVFQSNGTKMRGNVVWEKD